MTKTAASTTGWKRATVTFEITGGNPNLLTVPVTLLFDIADTADSYGAYIDNVILTPIEVMQPAIDQNGNAGALAKVDAVRMCRWGSKHHDLYQTVDDGDRSKFPDNDPDGAVIKIPDAVKPSAASITVHLSTIEGGVGYNDGSAELTFTKKAEYPGYFVSDRIVIVADSDDDLLPVGAGKPADNTDGDRSFLGRPGGKFVVHSPTGEFPDIQFPILPFAKQVKVQNVYFGLTLAEKGNFALAIGENKRRLRESFAAHGIKVYDAANHVDIIASDLGDSSNLLTKSELTKAELTQMAALLNSKVDQDAVKLVWLKSSIEPTQGQSTGG